MDKLCECETKKMLAEFFETSSPGCLKRFFAKKGKEVFVYVRQRELRCVATTDLQSVPQI